ncbi:hypothetical protein ZWY2020_022993 [Hordeum vulgare]|nr:hypothetical protein ZWY2020_022993 [Hordeum vulgare]
MEMTASGTYIMPFTHSTASNRCVGRTTHPLGRVTLSCGHRIYRNCPRPHLPTTHPLPRFTKNFAKLPIPARFLFPNDYDEALAVICRGVVVENIKTLVVAEVVSWLEKKRSRDELHFLRLIKFGIGLEMENEWEEFQVNSTDSDLELGHDGVVEEDYNDDVFEIKPFVSISRSLSKGIGGLQVELCFDDDEERFKADFEDFDTDSGYSDLDLGCGRVPKEDENDEVVKVDPFSAKTFLSKDIGTQVHTRENLDTRAAYMIL